MSLTALPRQSKFGYFIYSSSETRLSMQCGICISLQKIADISPSVRKFSLSAARKQMLTNNFVLSQSYFIILHWKKFGKSRRSEVKMVGKRIGGVPCTTRKRLNICELLSIFGLLLGWRTEKTSWKAIANGFWVHSWNSRRRIVTMFAAFEIRHFAKVDSWRVASYRALWAWVTITKWLVCPKYETTILSSDLVVSMLNHPGWR